MASRTLAGALGLKGDWALGEDNWKDENDLNLLKLSVLAGRKVLSRVAATPGAPTEGDIHIFTAGHPTQANKVAVYDEAAWVYLAPFDGLKLYSVADTADYQYTAALGWTLSAGGYTTEQIQDMIAAFLVAGTNVTLTYNDAGDALTIAATGGGGGSYTDEDAMDAIAAMLTAGTGITLSYNDAGDALTISATGGGGASRYAAAGRFTIAGSVATLVSGVNVASCVQTATGRWRVTFTTPLPSVNFGVNVNARFSDFADDWICLPGIDRHPTYGFSTASIDFNFGSSASFGIFDPAFFSFEIYDQTVDGGGGSGKWFHNFRPLDNEPTATDYATLDTRNGRPVLEFDAATQEAAVFTGVMGSSYGAGNITVDIFVAAESATTGNFIFDAAFERTDAGTLDIDADSFATAKVFATTAAPGTSGVVAKVSVTFTQVEADGLAAGELFRLRIRRVAADASDTMTGDAQLLAVNVREA